MSTLPDHEHLKSHNSKTITLYNITLQFEFESK